MPRMFRTEDGFSLVEVMVVVAIVGILATIATLQFNEWSVKASTESQVKTIYSDIMIARGKALFQKTPRCIKFTSRRMEVYCGETAEGTPETERDLVYPVVWSSAGSLALIKYDTTGMTNDPVSICINPENKISGSYDSLVISRSRVSLAKRKETAKAPCDRDEIVLK